MKMPIEWHEECLKNRKISIAMDEAEMQKRIAFLATKIARDKTEIEAYSRQIDAAKSTGKDGFDADRFLRKDKSNS